MTPLSAVKAACVDSWLKGKGKQATSSTDTADTRQPPRCPLCKVTAHACKLPRISHAPHIHPLTLIHHYRCPICQAIPLTADQLKKAGFTTSVDLSPERTAGAATSAANAPPVFSRVDNAPAEAAVAPAAAPAAAPATEAPWGQLVGWFSPGGTHHSSPQADNAGPEA